MTSVNLQSKHILPSIPAAIVAGGLMMPIFQIGLRHISAGGYSTVIFPFWVIGTFFLPIIFATMDFRYIARNSETFSDWFRPRYSLEDFRQLYIPSWVRMLVWFFSAAISTGLLRLVGVAM